MGGFLVFDKSKMDFRVVEGKEGWALGTSSFFFFLSSHCHPFGFLSLLIFDLLLTIIESFCPESRLLT